MESYLRRRVVKNIIAGSILLMVSQQALSRRIMSENPLNLIDAGAYGNGVDDDSVYIQKAVDSGSNRIYLPAHRKFLINQSIYIKKPVVIYGGGEIIIDWDKLGYTKSAFIVLANNTKFNNLLFSTVTVPKVLKEYKNTFVLDFFADNCMVAQCESLRGHPNFCRSSKKNASFNFIKNKGYGMVSGQSQDSIDHNFCIIHDGQKGLIDENYAENWGNMILLRLSSNQFTISNNVAKSCGNHLIYISSGNNNKILKNKAYGLYTDIKVRGNYNVIKGNSIDGGILGVTNAIVDYNNTGYGVIRVDIIDNIIKASSVRAKDLVFYVKNRKNYNSRVNIINVIGNELYLDGKFSSGLMVYFDYVKNLNILNNSISVVEGGSLKVAFLVVSSSRGMLKYEKFKTVTVSNNTISQCEKFIDSNFDIEDFIVNKNDYKIKKVN